jgi:hypothetical protein
MNAPERIWTTGTDYNGSWNAAPTSLGRYAPETEYVRSDLFAALTAEVEAMRKREAEARDAIGGLLMVYDGVPMTGVFAGIQADRARAYLAKVQP